MVFYFTGTGNSLYAAKELDAEIISIPQAIKQERLEFAADSIGIVCPAGCIHLENQYAVHNPKSCQACYACVHACPKMAVQLSLSRPEKNPAARYRNEHVMLSENW